MILLKNKILIELLVPQIEEKYDIYVPINKKVGTIIELIQKSIFELTDGEYIATNTAFLYNSFTGEKYDINKIVKDTDIRSGIRLVLM